MANGSNEKDTRLTVHILAALLGIGSCIVVNGVSSQLPILTEKLPEGINLPSYVSIVKQIANVGLIIYGVLHRFFPRYVHETSAAFIIFSVETVACLFLIFTWDVTAVIFGNCHSVVLIALLILVSIVDCTSSVVFCPFIGFFKAKYIISYSIGEGLNSLLLGLVSLGQGVGRTSTCENVTTGNRSGYMTVMVTSPPLFSVSVYFGFLFLVLVVSFMSFVLLRFLPSIESERTLTWTYKDSKTERSCGSNVKTSYKSDGSLDNPMDKETEKITKRMTNERFGISSKDRMGKESENRTRPLTNSTFIYLLSINIWISLITDGVIIPTAPYGCLPYGKIMYQLANSLAAATCPLVSFATFYFHVRKPAFFTIAVIIQSLMGVYLISLPISSPNPPFVGTSFGQALLIIGVILFFGMNTFVKTSISIVFRRKDVGALFWFGATSQIGGSIGAVLTFVVINVYHALKLSDSSCQ